MCRFCSGFARQMRLLRQAVRERGEQLVADPNDAAMGLSDEARQRIKAALRDDQP
jgi:hypothetical protein